MTSLISGETFEIVLEPMRFIGHLSFKRRVRGAPIF
jgi:hypothetical protein